MIIPARQSWYSVGLELSVDSYKDASTFAGRGRPARLGRGRVLSVDFHKQDSPSASSCRFMYLLRLRLEAAECWANRVGVWTFVPEARLESRQMTK